MNFERNIDPKEALKVGLKVTSPRIDHILIHGHFYIQSSECSGRSKGSLATCVDGIELYKFLLKAIKLEFEENFINEYAKEKIREAIPLCYSGINLEKITILVENITFMGPEDNISIDHIYHSTIVVKGNLFVIP